MSAQADSKIEGPSVTRLEAPRIHLWGLLPGSALLIVAMIAAGALILDNWTSGTEILQAQRAQATTYQFLAQIGDAETGQRGYLLTGKSIYLEPFYTSVKSVHATLDDLTGLAAGEPGLAQRVAEIAPLVDQKLAELKTTIAAFDRGGPGAALPIVLNDSGRTAMVRLRHLAEEILGSEGQILSDRTARWRQNSNWLVAVCGFTLLLIFGISALFITTLRRHTAVVAEARAQLAIANIALEDRIAERTADLQEANDEIQRYAYIVSHDLRSPLVNIMGYSAELNIVRTGVIEILEQVNLSPQQRERVTGLDGDFQEALSFIRQSNAKMDRLINAILKLARSGQREFRTEYLDMNLLIGTIKATLQHQILDKNVTLTINALPHLYADRLAIEQIFTNLIENAIKYMAPERPGRVSLDAISHGDQLSFAVEDNGRGISERDLSRIFDLFRRAGPQDQAGEGIGLAHVRSLVRRLGGKITCQSQLGIGSRFVVTLPRRTD